MYSLIAKRYTMYNTLFFESFLDLAENILQDPQLYYDYELHSLHIRMRMVVLYTLMVVWKVHPPFSELLGPAISFTQPHTSPGALSCHPPPPVATIGIFQDA